jgi:glycosyltransferase involved in cell wall biosynthesis
LSRKLRVLLELRPALAGHAGIPQATRLLFRSLLPLNGLEIEGLIQSSRRVLAAGLPAKAASFRKPLSADQELNQLGRVVISLDQGKWRQRLRTSAMTALMIINHALGGRQQLTVFKSSHFHDFLWRRLFERTLPAEDFDLVTQAPFRIAQLPWDAMHTAALVTRRLGCAVYPRLNTSDFDVMISETPYPASVSANTTLVVRYHDAIPLLMPHTIADQRRHQASHYRALRKNVESGAWFACVSEATRSVLLTLFPHVEARSVTIPNMLSSEYFDEPSAAARVPEIINSRQNRKLKPPLDHLTRRGLLTLPSQNEPLEYLLVVSTVEPRKNHLTLLTAWEQLRLARSENLKLVVVGDLGWHHEATVRRLRPWLERLEAFLLSDLPASELRVLYRHARATICPSVAEGFDYSGIESMKSGGAVAASNIPVHQEVYGAGATYFNPYDANDLVHCIEAIIDPAQSPRRAELIAKGAAVAARYDRSNVTPQWELFLENLRAREQ